MEVQLPTSGKGLLIGLLAPLLLLPASAISTEGRTVAALRTRSQVVIGSDSLISTIGPNGAQPKLGCKIAPIKAGFVAMSGIFADSRGFNAYQVAKDAALRGGTLSEIANRFERLARPSFSRMMRGLRIEDPREFLRYCEGRQCLEAAFVGSDPAIPLSLSVRGFWAKAFGQDLDIKPAKHVDCPGDCSNETEQVFLGDHEEATRLLDQTPHFWKVKGVTLGMKELLQAEISSHPEDAAAPITILVVDEDGPRWEPGYRGLCPETDSH
jgi:hypothetical protein